ncbi:MAG: Sir2 family NAD-dependent protein deacetylase [Cyanobacteria bacterium J06635_15]
MDPGTLNRPTAQAHAIVFLTGAGVSAPSGLPTYTNSDGKRVDEGSEGDSGELQKVYAELTSQIADAQPNAAHYYPGWLLAKGHNVEVVTQNIDGLYSKAGFPKENIHEIHGNFFRNDIVHFGKSIPEDVWTRARTAMKKANLLIVAGSGLWVSPTNTLPKYLGYRSTNRKSRIVVVNKGECSLMTSQWRRWIIAHHKGDCNQLFDSAMSIGAKYSALNS